MHDAPVLALWESRYPPRVSARLAIVVVLATGLGGASCGPVAARGLGRESPYWGPIASIDTERGRTRFQVVCAPCHVLHENPDAPELTALGWSPADVRHQIREGSALMPAIPERRLDDEDLEHLLAYLESCEVVREPSDVETLGSPEAQPKRPVM